MMKKIISMFIAANIALAGSVLPVFATETDIDNLIFSSEKLFNAKKQRSHAVFMRTLFYLLEYFAETYASFTPPTGRIESK